MSRSPHHERTQTCTSAGRRAILFRSPGLSSTATQISACTRPYNQLMRLEKPIGTVVLYLPCLFGITFVAASSRPIISPARLFKMNLVFLLGSFLVRSLGCTWNDYVDQDIDKLVERTKCRPLPRRAVSSRSTLIFVCVQLILGIVCVVALLPIACLCAGLPSIILTILYPFAKRHTSYPQAFLGIPASWGIVMAFPALEVAGEGLTRSLLWGTVCLVAFCILWTVLYNAIYAAQDVQDDLKIGLRSTMARYLGRARWFLRGIAAAQYLSLYCFQHFFKGKLPFTVLALLGSTIGLFTMVAKVDLDDRANCAWWFQYGNLVVGFAMARGFSVEYTQRLFESYSL